MMRHSHPCIRHQYHCHYHIRLWSFVLVDEKPDQATANEAGDNSERKGGGWKAQTYASNEDNGLKAFTENGNERQGKHGILLAPQLEAIPASSSGAVLGFQCFCQLDAPFVLELGYTEQSSTHPGDYERCKEPEGTFPDVFGARPVVLT